MTCVSITEAATDAEAARLESTPDQLALGAFVGAVLIGGSNFVAVRYSNRELDPLWGAGLRFALAAAVFGVFCVVVAAVAPARPHARPRARLRTARIRRRVRVHVLGDARDTGRDRRGRDGGRARCSSSCSPSRTGSSGSADGRSPGSLIALAGSALIFVQPDSASFGWASFAVLGLAALAASESVVVSKLIGLQHPVVMNFVGMTAGAAVLLVVSVVAGENLALPAEGKTQVAVVYLVAATVGLFVAVLLVVQRWTASSTSYIFVSMPVVAVVLGALIADERITLTTVARRRDRRRRRLRRRARTSRPVGTWLLQAPCMQACKL